MEGWKQNEDIMAELSKIERMIADQVNDLSDFKIII